MKHLEKYAKNEPDIVTFLKKYDRRFGLNPVFDLILTMSAKTGLRENGVYVVNIRESRYFERAAFFGKFHAPKQSLARNFFHCASQNHSKPAWLTRKKR